jgi:hypothetical protein
MGALFSRVWKTLILKNLQVQSVRTIFAQGVVPVLYCPSFQSHENK